MKTILAASLFCLFFGTASASTYYVVPYEYGGRDNGEEFPPGVVHDGSSDLKAFATPKYASTHVTAGATVYLLSDVFSPSGRTRVTTATYGTAQYNPAPGHQGELLPDDDSQIAPPSNTAFAAWNDDDIHIEAPTRVWNNIPENASHGIFILQGVNSVYIQHLSIGNCANPGDIYSSGILCLGSQNIQITDCHIYNTWGPSIKLYGCSNVVIDHNELETPEQQEGLDGKAVDGGLPIGFSSNNVVVSYNTMHDIPGTDGANFVGVYATTSYIQILGNKIYNVGGQNMGVYIISGHDIDVFNNEVYNCWRGIVVSNENFPDGTTVQGVDIYNNICHDNAAGIVITPSGAGDRPISDVHIINNTVAYNAILNDGQKVGGVGIEILTRASTGVVVRNNIVAYNGIEYHYSPTPNCDIYSLQINNGLPCAVIDHNLVSGFLYKYQPIEPDTKIGDPLFCSRATNDYHVATGSPALNVGLEDPLVTNDYDGNSRDPDNDGKVTIGAFEPASVCSPVASGLETSHHDYIITIHPTLNGSSFASPYSIRLNNSNPVISISGGDAQVLNQPQCFTGSVTLEAAGYYAEATSGAVTNLNSSPTLNFTMLEAFHGTITANTTWSGTKVLDGDVKVNSGVTLTINRGTIIEIAPTDAANISPGNVGLVDLIVAGTIRLPGTTGSNVTFRALGVDGPCLWGGIILNGSWFAGTTGSNPINFVVLRDSRYGLTVNTSGQWTINNWTFANNLSRDVSIVSGPAGTIATSTFDLGTGDGIQVLSSTGTITIRDNTFTGAYLVTQSAIFVNDSGSAANSPAIYQNHINGDTSQPTARTGNGLYCLLGDPLVYNNDIRNWENGIYITGGQPLIGQTKSGSTRRGNQMSGCTNGINAVCATCSPSCITSPTNVKYNIIANNTVGVIATAAINLGQSGGLGTNHIYGNSKCVWKQDNCATTVSAIGNYWDTSGTPCPEPTCKVPNTSAINTSQPQCGNFSQSNGGCSFCDPPANAPSMAISLPPGPEIVPERTALMGIHPNPFNPTTTVDFDLKESAWTTISIYNVSGQLVRVESLATQPAGKHNWVWKGTDQRGNSVASGVYFVVLRAGTVTDRMKAVLLK